MTQHIGKVMNKRGLTPRGRLRRAVQLLDRIVAWDDRTGKLPDDVLNTLYEAQGLVAVTVRDAPGHKRTASH